VNGRAAHNEAAIRNAYSAQNLKPPQYSQLLCPRRKFTHCDHLTAKILARSSSAIDISGLARLTHRWTVQEIPGELGISKP
jgi:hypothetical protein